MLLSWDAAMSSDIALQFLSELLKLGLVIGLPLLGVVLVVGLLISVLQVVTQIQDPSIAFVPKLGAFIVALVLLAPWMLNRLTAYGMSMFERLAHIG
jgi:flagellar biosynthetic protein FliQ